jgi:hypothetical protein
VPDAAYRGAASRPRRSNAAVNRTPASVNERSAAPVVATDRRDAPVGVIDRIDAPVGSNTAE